MTKTLRITAKRPGFRRCGVAHPDQPVDHAADDFTWEQIERLKADPMLVVQGIFGDTADSDPAGPGEIEGLRAELEMLQRDYRELDGRNRTLTETNEKLCAKVEELEAKLAEAAVNDGIAEGADKPAPKEAAKPKAKPRSAKGG